jgi:chromosome segregation ATPase
VSASEAPDSARLAELERVARGVVEEIARWRERCLAAEAELAELRARGASFVSGDIAQARERTTELEAENRELARRIAIAREQVEQLRTRLRFVEEGAFGARR